MKQLAKYFSLFILLIIYSFQVNAAPETFILDNKHTYVLWSIEHLGFSTQYGKWYASGKLILDQDNPSQSKVDVTINVADMVTGVPELDEHLKSKLFFDTKQFPTATFVSNKVTPTGKDTATVDGTLTLRGVSRPVVLQVTLNKQGMNPINNKMSAGFTATTAIKRSDFGINAFLPALSDTVNIKIGAEAYLDKKAG
ncbi:polyprenyl-pyrophosphate binding protein [Legionella gratiana]|uniref:Polyprenyl-pyrophosphate binding protein n=1 Tax=Legionella gratiana TaxID=45066 RepID=A0A378JBB3_9GAMM|nr:YceI family protein [Legionella gratiana]KTD15687.1 polyprenyl-pyrophosphate binding protein [Legionella gratiana]STX44749.1 polyprenyl-pyrophosphate binding protein [Legionella gratiana]